MKGKIKGNKIKGTLLIAVLLLTTLAILPMASAIDSSVLLTDTETTESVDFGYVDDGVTVTTTTVTMGGLIKVYWDSVKAWDGMAGLLAEDYAVGDDAEIDIVIPEAVAGLHYVIVKDMEASETAAAEFIVVPMIELDPISGIIGDPITVTGTGFSPSEDVGLFLDYPASIFQMSGTGTAEWVTATGDHGDSMVKLQSPGEANEAKIWVRIEPDDTPLTLQDFYDGDISTLAYDYYLESGTLIPNIGLRFMPPGTINPYDVDLGEYQAHVDITFTDLPLEDALETWDTSGTITDTTHVVAFWNELDGTVGSNQEWADWTALKAGLETAMDPDAILTWELVWVAMSVAWSVDPTGYVDDLVVGTHTYDLEPPILEETTDTFGSFETTLTIPTETSDGDYKVFAVDSMVDLAEDDLKVGTCITLTPKTGLTGTTVTIEGRGFTKDKTVDVQWYFATLAEIEAEEYDYDTFAYLTKVDNYELSSTGAFTTSFTVPDVETGEYVVRAIDSDSTLKSAISTYTVKGATEITLDPTSNLAGESVSVTGVWFTSGKTVTIYFDDEIVGTETAATTDTYGFDKDITIPEDATLGAHTIKAMDSEGIYDTATFTVIEEVITIETNSESYDPDDTISFTIESTVAFVTDDISIEIYDPDGIIFWELPWKMIEKTAPATGYYVPYSEQLDPNYHLTLPSDATPGIWEWTATYQLIAGTDIEVTGTFLVGEPSGPQPDLPAETTDQVSKDSTGAPKTSFVLGETVLASAEVSNTGTQSQPMLIMVQWKDPQLHTLAPVFIIVELAPGQSFTYAPGVMLPPTGFATGTWTARVLIYDTWIAQGGVVIGTPVEITITVS